MFSRLPLYLHSVWNMFGKATGSKMAYTAAQTAVAKLIYDFWKSKGCDDETAAAFVGCVEGETSFIITARGDKGEAGGIAQYHGIRRNLILRNAKVDVWSSDLSQQLAGQYAEITAPWSSYRHVLMHVMMADGLEAKMRILIHEFEQSGQQDRDVARRTPMAKYWLAQFGAKA